MTRAHRVSGLVLALAVAAATPALADMYYVYGDAGIPPGADIFLWADCLYAPPFICDFAARIDCNTPEGGSSQGLFTNQWGGWGVFPPQPVDLSAFENGEIRFFVKSPFDLTVGFNCTVNSTTQTYDTLISQQGWVNESPPTWQEITIPVCDLFPGGDCQPHLECLQNVEAPFHVNRPDVTLARDFLVDYVRWETANSHTGASSVEVQGRQLLVNGEPFVVNGVAYAPISIGENWQGAWRDRPDRYLVDFPLMAAGGVNTVRLYAPVMSTAMLDAAQAEGLYVIPTFGVNPEQLTCAEGKSFMQDRFVEMVEAWKDHPAILFWLVGNEVNSNLGGADLCADWFPQLDDLALAAHGVDSSHPVGTANAETNNICQSSCSTDTDLPNVDLWGLQAYRGCQLATVFADYLAKPDCSRPVIVTEFGVDAWDSRDPGEDQVMQATCLDNQLVDAGQALAIRTPGGASSGQIVFEWLDEWWKASCVDPAYWDVQDTCTSFTNTAYGPGADTAVNEEWWGIVTQDGADPDNRVTRAAYTTMGDAWLGAVCDMQVDGHDPVSGNTTISFAPAAGNAVDHNLYYGPLSAVSSYGYSGSVTGLGASGPSVVTLPAGSLFWVIAAENGVSEEGCYGTDSEGVERPCFSGNCEVDQIPGWNCLCSSP